ncbi:MAG: HDOD domain-containing protein [Ignavibacteria bacterium]
MENLNLTSMESKRAATESVLNGVKNLPLIPKVMFEVARFLQNPEANTTGLAKLISKDQGLTTKILSIANSPLFGLQRKVFSLEFAIIVLGYKEISDVVTAISLADSLKVSSDKDFDQNDFWIHSMVVGTASKSIAHNLGYMDLGSDAFVAGTLHEFGIQLLHRIFHPQFLEICAMAEKGEAVFFEAEQEKFGLSHQEIGKFLGEKWNLPEVLCNILSYHHFPSKSPGNKILASIVHLADYMTQELQVANCYWDKGMQLDKEIINILQLKSEENLKNFIMDFKELFIDTASSIRL